MANGRYSMRIRIEDSFSILFIHELLAHYSRAGRIDLEACVNNAIAHPVYRTVLEYSNGS